MIAPIILPGAEQNILLIQFFTDIAEEIGSRTVDEVLSELLGLSAEEIAALHADEVLR